MCNYFISEILLVARVNLTRESENICIGGRGFLGCFILWVLILFPMVYDDFSIKLCSFLGYFFDHNLAYLFSLLYISMT